MERAFSTLYGRVRSMLNSARLNKEFRQGLWAECASTACALDNLDCSGKMKPDYVAFYGKDYKGFKLFKKFGEIGIVTRGDKTKSKLTNRGEDCFYLGLVENHCGEVARFLKLNTKRVIRSRDETW